MTESPASSYQLRALMVFIAVLSAPGLAIADDHFRITPSVSATTLQETNVFATASSRQSDFIMRLTSGADVQYRSTIWTLAGRCSIDAERYASHPELTTFNARRHAEIGLTYAPTRRLTIDAGAELSGTETPGELNRETGLVFTRAAAQRAAVRGSIARKFDREMTGTIAYGFASDTLAGFFDTRVHDFRLSGERRLSSRDTARAGYRVQAFSFSGIGLVTPAAVSQTFTIGMTRSVTRQTTVAIDAGPQLTDGALGPDLLVAVRHDTASFDYVLSYGHTQAIVFGLAGTAATDSVTTTVAWAQRRALQVRVSPAFYESRTRSARAQVGRVAINVTRTLLPGISVDAGVDAGIQQGNLFPSVGDTTIPYRTVAITIVATPPARAAR